MKIFPISDIHILMRPDFFLEDNIKEFFDIVVEEAGDDKLVLCFCGDVGDRYFGLSWLTKVSNLYPDLDILYLLGNHEFYGSNLELLPEDLFLINNLAGSRRIHIFDNNDHFKYTIGDVTFIGATLWSDFNKQSPAAMNIAQRSMNDYRYIKSGIKYNDITANTILNHHCCQKKYIFKALKETSGKKVVMTHHLPYVDFDGHSGDALAYAYGSDFDEKFNELPAESLPIYWLSGHTHTSRVKIGHFTNGDIQFISNQMGYPQELYTGFTTHCILEV